MTSQSIRKKLEKIKPLILGCSLFTARAGQSAIGKLLYLPRLKNEDVRTVVFPSFKCGIITPEEYDGNGVIIYLHGGGYTCGGLDYAKGYASVLAEITGKRVIFPAYRLAPENKFPSALADCFNTFRYVTNVMNIKPEKIILCGESAGGGLVYSLVSVLKGKGLALPSGIVAISPWTDLTMSGESYLINREKDPSMSIERLRFFAENYTSEPENPLCSPLFASLDGFPPSLMFSGSDEIMLSDSLLLAEKLKACNNYVNHIIAQDLWHAYPMYRLSDRECDDIAISEFVKDILNNEEKFKVAEA